jgi:uncharacterized membrane protein YkoI
MKRRLAFAALMLCAALPAAGWSQPYPDNGRPVFGAEGGEQDRARDAVRAGRQMPLSRVLAIIAQRTPGRQLNTMQGDSGGRPTYVVQWQTPGGQVVIFVVDAESGAIISRQDR